MTPRPPTVREAAAAVLKAFAGSSFDHRRDGALNALGCALASDQSERESYAAGFEAGLRKARSILESVRDELTIGNSLMNFYYRLSNRLRYPNGWPQSVTGSPSTDIDPSHEREG